MLWQKKTFLSINIFCYWIFCILVFLCKNRNPPEKGHLLYQQLPLKIVILSSPSFQKVGRVINPAPTEWAEWTIWISTVTLSENSIWVSRISGCINFLTYCFTFFSVVATFEVTSCIFILKYFHCSHYLVSLPFLLLH